MTYNPPDLKHRDPADRLLIATVINLKCPMVTYDRKIIDFAKHQGGTNGFSVETWVLQRKNADRALD